MEETVQRETGEVRAEPRETTCLTSGFEKRQQSKEAEETQVKQRVETWEGVGHGARSRRERFAGRGGGQC